MSYFQYFPSLPLFSQFFPILWSLSPSTSTARCHLGSHLPSITSSTVLNCFLVWCTPWLPAGLCLSVHCHAGLHEQSSGYWCRPFTSSGSIHAESSTAGPMMAVWAHAVGAQDPLGQRKLTCRVQIHNFVLVHEHPVPSKAGWLATDKSSFLFAACRATKWKAVAQCCNAQWARTAEEMGLQAVQIACLVLSRGDLAGLLWTSCGRLFWAISVVTTHFKNPRERLKMFCSLQCVSSGDK